METPQGSSGADAGRVDIPSGGREPRSVRADTAINSASTSEGQQGSPIADILENFQRLTPRDQFVVRPSVVERLRGLGIDDPAAILAAVGGDDGLADEEPPTFNGEELIAECVDDPSKVFAPDAIAYLAALKQEDRAEFESLRQRLKGAGCRVTALDRAIAEERGETGRGPTQADILVKLADEADLFHSADGTEYADVQVNGSRQTYPVASKGFKNYLTRGYFEATGGAPSSEAIQSALNVIKAKAQYDAPERVVAVRIAGTVDRFFLDLGDDQWRSIEISADGWKLTKSPPEVRFRRAAGMQPLPEPVRGGTVTRLLEFLNVKVTDFILVVAWLLAALRPRGPYPAIVLSGEQGSAKSSFAAMLRYLIDPNTAPLRALPREDRDLFIAARNGHLLVFDNVSGLPGWISDTLCRLATGGGFAVRQLYADADEVLFDATRPIVLNGIEDVVTRPDLADRSLLLVLDPIPDDQRRAEGELWKEFEAARPEILGALLDAVVHGLRNPATTPPVLPRMADFALWATACETAIWPAGTFMRAYGANRADAVATVIDGDVVAAAVRSLMSKRVTPWTGSATQLRDALSAELDDAQRKAKSWPTEPRVISGRVRRAATFLRQVGIDVTFGKVDGKRTIAIRNSETDSQLNLASAASSGLGIRDADFVAASTPASSVHASVHENVNEYGGGDAEDAGDAGFPDESAPENDAYEDDL